MHHKTPLIRTQSEHKANTNRTVIAPTYPAPSIRWLWLAPNTNRR
nr:MAG TPA: hypothetical protein [Caudoviricetes sp.]